jgi:hypothetical protein
MLYEAGTKYVRVSKSMKKFTHNLYLENIERTGTHTSNRMIHISMIIRNLNTEDNKIRSYHFGKKCDFSQNNRWNPIDAHLKYFCVQICFRGRIVLCCFLIDPIFKVQQPGLGHKIFWQRLQFFARRYNLFQ